MEVLSLARNSTGDLDALWIHFRDKLNISKSDSRNAAVRESFERLGEHVVQQSTGHGERFSTIHKAKGLEADAVLVVAKTNNDITKWLVRDRDERMADKQDKCRLGYVAFSRARECLAIGCLQELSAENETALKGLGVTVVP